MALGPVQLVSSISQRLPFLVMAAARPLFNSVPRVSSPIPDEASPLLKPRRTHAHRQTISERWRTAWSSFLDDNSGLLLVVASQFFFSAMGVAVKWLIDLDDPVPTLELILVRMKIPDPFFGPKGLRALLVLRGLTGFFSLAGMYFSLQYLSLSDATVLTFIAPILTSFSGAVFLKESLSFRETLSGLCSFLGVVLIARPQFLFGSQAFSDPSEELVTPAQRMTSIASEGSRSLPAWSPFSVRLENGHIFSNLLISSLHNVPLVVPTRFLWLAMMFVVGILGLIGQALLTMGLQRETAGRSALAIYSSIVFAIVFEFIFSRTTPSPLSVIGTLIILTKKRPVTKPDSAPERPALNQDDDLEAISGGHPHKRVEIFSCTPATPAESAAREGKAMLPD
ncbi:hypothetical protein EDB92DRAFT_1818055 [Lactarius akahatsu]|uniref:EamA domain-containing protein n=1 Tax=Lactarius akahatsu TaxID=416441 RepID=A0AAD4LD97_9AGAM|nr:hypothetical protein EDB92DRAFT_1818055 [Lactarius akahatsu]